MINKNQYIVQDDSQPICEVWTKGNNTHRCDGLTHMDTHTDMSDRTFYEKTSSGIRLNTPTRSFPPPFFPEKPLRHQLLNADFWSLLKGGSITIALNKAESQYVDYKALPEAF